MTNPMDEIPGELLDVTHKLANNLAQSEPFMRLKKANRKVEADPQAAQLRTEFSHLQMKVRAQQYTSDYSQEDVIRLRSLQDLVYKNQALKEQAAAQEDAVNLLRDVNQLISGNIKMDFGALTRRVSDD